jgi:hypothetical protein
LGIFTAVDGAHLVLYDVYHCFTRYDIPISSTNARGTRKKHVYGLGKLCIDLFRVLEMRLKDKERKL